MRHSRFTHLVGLIAVFSMACATRVAAFRLVPPPSLPDDMVQDFLAHRIGQPATLGDIKLTETRTPLHVTVGCDVELILNESFYTVVPASDPIFTPVASRLADLRQAQEQLNLVPKDFIASLGGQKSTASLAFLKHTFVRTTVPAQSRARIGRIVFADHTERFFDGKWFLTLQGPLLAVDSWRGKTLSQFENPLPVDTADFQRQLSAFLDTAKKTLDEVDDISNRFIAKADQDRAEIFKALPVGAVLAVKDAGNEGPLFLEVKKADQKIGEIGFSIASSYASRPARTELLLGVHTDPAAKLREFLERRRLAEMVRALPAVNAPRIAETPEPRNSPAPVEVSAKQALEGEQPLELSLESGVPTVRAIRPAKKVSLERIPVAEIDSARARFQQELEALAASTGNGMVYQGTVDNVPYFLGVKVNETGGRVFILQADAPQPKPVSVESELLDVEREHPALRLQGGYQLPSALTDVVLTSKGSEVELTGTYGAVRFRPVADRRILASNRIVTAEVADFLSRLRLNSRGLYLYADARFASIPSAQAPAQSTGSAFGSALLSIGTLGLGSLPSTTLHFSGQNPITLLDKKNEFYALLLNGQFTLLPLTKTKSDYTFTAVRVGSNYVPRSEDFVSGMIPKELDNGIYSLSVLGVQQTGVFALVQQDGGTYTYYLVQIEP